MSFWTLYFLSRLDSLKDMFSGLGVVSGIVAVIAVVVYVIFKADPSLRPYCSEAGKYIEHGFEKLARKASPFLIGFCFLCIVGWVFTPTFKETLAFISVDYITHNERVIENGEKLLDLVEDVIDDKLQAISGTPAEEVVEGE